MKSSVNIVVITGNLVEAPELQNGSGVDYVRFRIGSNRRWKDGQGNDQERADFSTASPSTAPRAAWRMRRRAPRCSSTAGCS